MKKKIRKLSALIFGLVMVLSMDASASYARGYHVIPEKEFLQATRYESGAILNGYQKPIYSWNLEKDGKYEFSGKTKSDNLYTNYYLTGKSFIHVSVRNNTIGRDFDVTVYKKSFGKDENLGTHTISANTNLNFYLSGLKESDKIYLFFASPCDFSGYIE